jgi:hypothetical protein
MVCNSLHVGEYRIRTFLWLTHEVTQLAGRDPDHNNNVFRYKKTYLPASGAEMVWDTDSEVEKNEFRFQDTILYLKENFG